MVHADHEAEQLRAEHARETNELLKLARKRRRTSQDDDDAVIDVDDVVIECATIRIQVPRSSSSSSSSNDVIEID